MAGPLDDVVVIDLTRALAGPHCGMMLADMGARVIKVETPGGGDESRGWGPPFVGPDDEPVSTYFLSCNRNKESVTLDLKSDEGRATLTLLRRARRAPRELPPRRPRPARLPRRAAARAQPGARAAVDQRVRPRRPRGRSRRLRPDRPGRGRPDVAHRRRPRRPAARRRADRRPARRHVRRIRRRLGAARAPPHREGEGRAHVPAGVDRRRPRLPGHALHRRGRGRSRGAATTTRRSAPTACSLRRRDDPAGLRQREPLAEAGGRLRDRHRRAGVRDEPRARRQPRPRRRHDQRGLRRHPRSSPSLPGSRRSASPPARSARSTASTSGSRPAARVWSSMSTTRCSAASRSPDRRSGWTTTRMPVAAASTPTRPCSASTTTPSSRGSTTSTAATAATAEMTRRPPAGALRERAAAPSGRPRAPRGSARPRHLRLVGRGAARRRRAGQPVRRGARRRRRARRHRRGDHHRRGPDPRPPGRRRRRGVPLPRGVDRPRRRRAGHARLRARDPRAPAALRRPGIRRDPDAGGHTGIRDDGEDLRRGGRVQGREPAVHRLPATPHDRRRPRVVGVARPRHRGGTGCHHRVPGARVYEALYGEAFPDDVQTAENLYAHGLLDAVQPMEALPAIAGRFLDIVLTPPDLTPRARGAQGAPRRRARVGVDHAVPPPGATGGARPAQARRHRRRAAVRHRCRRVGPQPLPRRRPFRGDAVRRARAGPSRPSGPRRRSGRRGCGSPGAG